ncbi:uncharacterized protein LOC118496190 [Sander lucioperca]|uniref:uncharacterized protein LOC118496190 n=1 Tax=Sander lucioperca TaxID=283035 RepID=UPI0016537F9F|nr:uncharacterized protein LOC118496190 [Sander lucioperca]
MDEHHKKVCTFPQETQIGHEEENKEAIPEKTAVKTKWRHSAAPSQQGKRGQDEGKTEDVPMEEADSGLEELATDDMVMADYVGAPPGASTLGSPLDSKVNVSPFGSRPEILAGTHLATKDFEMDPPGFSDVSKSGKSWLESDESDPLLWSEQVKSGKKSVDTKSDGMQGHANGKGALGDDAMLHILLLRGLESDQSGFRDPIFGDGSLGESDFDSGIEKGGARHLGQFTGAAKTKRQEEVQEFSKTITRPHRVSSGSVSSEEMLQDSPIKTSIKIRLRDLFLEVLTFGVGGTDGNPPVQSNLIQQTTK